MSPDDILHWPDGTWCYRNEHREMSHMSDDYAVFRVNSVEWARLAYCS